MPEMPDGTYARCSASVCAECNRREAEVVARENWQVDGCECGARPTSTDDHYPDCPAHGETWHAANAHLNTLASAPTRYSEVIDSPVSRPVADRSPFMAPPAAPKFNRRWRTKANPSRRYVSPEIEVASVDTADFTNLKRTLTTWGGGTVRDGSLPSGGFEINVAPSRGDAFLAQVRDITNDLSAIGAVADSSCGLHVHVDARDLGYDDLARATRLWAAFEGTFFRMQSPRRAVSGMCASSHSYAATLPDAPTGVNGAFTTETESLRTRHGMACGTALRRAVYGTSRGTRTLMRDKYNRARYHAWNLHSFFYRKTIEVRLHGGTTQYGKITAWSMLLADFVDYAKDSSNDTVRATVADAAANPVETLQSICKSDTAREYVPARIATYARAWAGTGADPDNGRGY